MMGKIENVYKYGSLWNSPLKSNIVDIYELLYKYNATKMKQWFGNGTNKYLHLNEMTRQYWLNYANLTYIENELPFKTKVEIILGLNFKKIIPVNIFSNTYNKTSPIHAFSE